ncbi:MAG: helix-turn-helix transcriptional regulator [Thermoleophilaceae bacterium]
MSRRFFRHGELPLVVLALLAGRPMHGYELMSELGRLFGPRYRPSPGSVYPALEALEAEGLLAGETDAGRTTYRATAAATGALADRTDDLAALELRTGVHIRSPQTLESELARFKARLAPLSGRIDVTAVAPVLDRAAAEIESRYRLTTEEARR